MDVIPQIGQAINQNWVSVLYSFVFVIEENCAVIDGVEEGLIYMEC